VKVSDPDKLLIATERIRSVLHQAPLVLPVTAINSVLTAVVLNPVVDHRLLTIWVVAIVAVSGVRWVIRQRFRRALDGGRYRLLAAISIIGSVTTGVLWGLGAVVLFPAVETYQLFWAFVIGGMCAGTTSVNSAHMPTVLAFVLPASLPLAGRFLVAGSEPLFISGIMILIFAVALSLASLRTHRAFAEHIRLQFALSRQGRALSDANDRLHGEVAERQKAEATLHQAQKMDAIGHLTGGIAHDFNNLLQVVTANLSMIERLSEGNARILGYVRAAEQAAQHGSRLNGSLLAFARRQSQRVERVNLNTLLEDFERILRRAINEQIKLRMFLEPGLPDSEVDPAQFQSAILNVVINARDAMPEGGQLTIATGVTTLGMEELAANADASPGRFVSVSVCDNGAGMTPEVLARVFEPFFTTKEVGKGSGLGLSQVYGFVRQSGGHLHLDSQPGTGTRLTMYLPVVEEAQPAST
jgi:signal transduction histidine kinase